METHQREALRMEIYIVVDTKGSGRILGAFDARDRAEEIVNAYPAYYKLHVCTLNAVNPEVLDWADDDDQRATLKELLARQGT